MAGRLTYKDCTLTITDGSGSPIAVNAFARTFTLTPQGGTVDVSGWGDDEEVLKGGRLSGQAVAELLIQEGGPVSVTMMGPGNISSTDPATNRNGIWVGNEIKMADGQATTQTLTLKFSAA